MVGDPDGLAGAFTLPLSAGLSGVSVRSALAAGSRRLSSFGAASGSGAAGTGGVRRRQRQARRKWRLVARNVDRDRVRDRARFFVEQHRQHDRDRDQQRRSTDQTAPRTDAQRGCRVGAPGVAVVARACASGRGYGVTRLRIGASPEPPTHQQSIPSFTASMTRARASRRPR
ncbi:MAG: hypothetical protein ACK4V1_00105 [Burkholderiaceae bacterium]